MLNLAHATKKANEILKKIQNFLIIVWQEFWMDISFNDAPPCLPDRVSLNNQKHSNVGAKHRPCHLPNKVHSHN